MVPSLKEFKTYLSLNLKCRQNLSSYKDKFERSVSQEVLETPEYYQKLYFSKKKY